MLLIFVELAIAFYARKGTIVEVGPREPIVKLLYVFFLLSAGELLASLDLFRLMVVLDHSRHELVAMLVSLETNIPPQKKILIRVYRQTVAVGLLVDYVLVFLIVVLMVGPGKGGSGPSFLSK